MPRYSVNNLPPLEVLQERKQKLEAYRLKYKQDPVKIKASRRRKNKINRQIRFLTPLTKPVRYILPKSYNGNPLKLSRFRKAVVSYLMVKQDSKCAYCGLDITYKYQIDHIQPMSIGGTHGIANLCLSCPMCNRAKWDMPLDSFKSWLKHVHS